MTLVGLAAKNIGRNKFRTALTVLGVAVAVLTFVFLRTVILAWGGAATLAASDRLITRNKMSMVSHFPIRYADEIRAMPGVKSATHARWFGGSDPKHEKEFFAVYAVDTKSWFETVDDQVIPADQKSNWLQDRQGIMIGDVIAKKLGVSLGDKLILTSGLYDPRAGEQWSFNVDAIYTAKSKAVDRTTMYFHYEYLNDALNAKTLPPDVIHWVTTLPKTGSTVGEVSRAIDEHFDEKEMQTRSQDERADRTAFLESISAVLSGLDIITVAIMLIMLLILGNTIAMGVRERTNEYGVLRALGFLPRHVALFILGEAMLIGLLGGLLGLLIAVPLIQFGIGPAIEENAGFIFPSFTVHPLIVLAAIVVAVLLGAVAAAIPAYRASRLQIVDALRRVA